ncbi:MAG: hypothetical protein ACKVTZ_09150 [Bacteroidia bacterium]
MSRKLFVIILFFALNGLFHTHMITQPLAEDSLWASVMVKYPSYILTDPYYYDTTRYWRLFDYDVFYAAEGGDFVKGIITLNEGKWEHCYPFLEMYDYDVNNKTSAFDAYYGGSSYKHFSHRELFFSNIWNKSLLLNIIHSPEVLLDTCYGSSDKLNTAGCISNSSLAKMRLAELEILGDIYCEEKRKQVLSFCYDKFSKIKYDEEISYDIRVFKKVRF